MQIGNNIKALRRAKGVTQEVLADALGISYQAVSKWETGANTPDIALLPAIASFFSISIDALFEETPVFSPASLEPVRDDDVLRILILRGTKLLRCEKFTQDAPPLRLDFGDVKQDLCLEIYGSGVAPGGITGNVSCSESVSCGEIIGDIGCIAVNAKDIIGNVSAASVECHDVTGQIKCDSIIAGEITTTADIICQTLSVCDTVICRDLNCAGQVKCDTIIHKGRA